MCSASVVEVEGGPDRRERLARRAKIIRRQTVAVVGRSGIMDDVEGVGDGEEVRSANHARRNSGAELLNLTANVPQEGIATPSAYQHDCVETGTSLRYIAMAAPLRREWVPISSDEKPRRSLPIAAAAARSLALMRSDRMKIIVPSKRKEFTGDSSDDPG